MGRSKRQIEENKSVLLFFSILAVLLFVPLFVFQQIGPMDFWWWMSLNLIIVIGLGLLTDHYYVRELKKDFSRRIAFKITYGLFSALVLYLLFFFGNILIRNIFEEAAKGISNVYAFKGDAPSWRIAVLMLLVIGPGEELFWRGFLQRKYANRFGKYKGFILGVIIYTAVHIATGNLVLILAALVCGIFWGWLYMKYKSMLLNIISHTVWDLAVFLIIPFS